VTDETVSAAADIREVLQALDNQSRCLAAIGRACLAGLAAVSDDARGAIDESLAGETPKGAGRGAVEAFLGETRQWLATRASGRDLLLDRLESALVRKADALPEPERPANDRARPHIAALG